uniref:Uncharacterized protein n=1 Tax=Ciona intestinalis TaxID=7719 RepID=H2XK57_CIOIN
KTLENSIFVLPPQNRVSKFFYFLSKIWKNCVFLKENYVKNSCAKCVEKVMSFLATFVLIFYRTLQIKYTILIIVSIKSKF